MINLTRLYCGISTQGDEIRYSRIEKQEKKPIVVWNITNKCNLKCRHCYATDFGELQTQIEKEEAINIIKDLGNFNIPVLLFSGGEPLLRKDISLLVAKTRDTGIKPVISSNGVLLTKQLAKDLKNAGVAYIGISLDGIGKAHDEFRGVVKSFDLAMLGIKNCQEAGIKVGIRTTLTKWTYPFLEQILELTEREQIKRICFYHLVYTGRGKDIVNEDLSYKETRECLNKLLYWTSKLANNEIPTEVLTVDNHSDGVFIYMKLLQENNKKAEDILQILTRHGGAKNSSGVGIACIDTQLNVHPDQFWQKINLGNIRQQSFKDIWQNTENEFLQKLRDRTKYIKGRCSICKWLEICGGGMRARAHFIYNDPWMSEPACYLTDQEIGI